jgi:hypothetical protein
MKANFWFSAVVSIGLLLALPLTAQEQQHRDSSNKHHHYKVTDIGTFGGPSSLTQDELKVLSSGGAIAGYANTSVADPNYPNTCVIFCGPIINHGFRWQNGMMENLGPLPGGDTSEAFAIGDSGLAAGFSENGEFDPLFGTPELHAVLWDKLAGPSGRMNREKLWVRPPPQVTMSITASF